MISQKELAEWHDFPDEEHVVKMADAPVPPEPGFLIEANKPDGTTWLYIQDTHVGWTGSSSQALRFARQVDAEHFLSAFVALPGVHVVPLGAC